MSAISNAFAPHFLLAQNKGIVPTMIDDAAKATIKTTNGFSCK